jgi:hypothetical protein
MRLKRSKCPSLENWTRRTGETLAWRLYLLAKYEPEVYAYFKERESFYLERLAVTKRQEAAAKV